MCSNTAAGLAVLPTSACDLHVPHSTVCKCCWCRGCMGMFCESAVWVGITGCPPMQQSITCSTLNTVLLFVTDSWQVASGKACPQDCPGHKALRCMWCRP